MAYTTTAWGSLPLYKCSHDNFDTLVLSEMTLHQARLHATSTTTTSWRKLPGGWDTTWLRAKELASGAVAGVLILGDSVAQGAFATPDWRTAGWPGLVRDALWQEKPICGEYYDLSHSVYCSPAYVGTPPWVVNEASYPAGVSSFFTSAGYCSIVRFTGAIVNPMLTFTSPIICKDLEPVYQNPYVNNGTWSYKVDGGSTVVNQMVANSAIIRKLAINNLLATTTHTFQVTAQSADNAEYIYGINCFQDRTRGIFFANISRAGNVAYAYTNPVQPLNVYRLFQGYTDVGQSNTGFGPPVGADLAIISLGLNDCQLMLSNGGVGPSRYEYTTEKIVKALRRGRPDCSIMFVAPNNPEAGFTDLVGPSYLANPEYWYMFTDVMERIAEKYGCAMLNFDTKWYGQAGALGFQSSGVHPTNAGHIDIANAILELI